MQKLRAASNSIDLVPADEILEALLVEAGVAGELPTNERKVLRFLGLEQLSFDFMKELYFLEFEQKPAGELRAVLHMGERVVATQAGMSDQRTRFSVFHEVGHCVLPEHHARLFVDTDQTLSFWTKVRFEREANQFAAELLFQGRLFAEQALSLRTSLQSAIDLAPRYGASFEATFRRYTECQVLPCALIVYRKVARNDESFVEDDDYAVDYTVTSALFRRTFFSGVEVGNGSCRAAEIFAPGSAWAIGHVAEKELAVEGPEGVKWRFEAEVFSNGYKVFQFLRRPTKGPQP